MTMERRYPERPLVGVGAVIIRDGKVLLVKRGTEPLRGEWSIPGGLLECGETLEAAIQREVKEETGLDIRIERLAEVVERILPDAEERIEYHYILIDYVCSVSGGELRAASDVDDARWFSPDELEKTKIAGITRQVIWKALSR